MFSIPFIDSRVNSSLWKTGRRTENCKARSGFTLPNEASEAWPCRAAGGIQPRLRYVILEAVIFRGLGPVVGPFAERHAKVEELWIRVYFVAEFLP